MDRFEMPAVISVDLLGRLVRRTKAVVIYRDQFAFAFSDSGGEVDLTAYRLVADSYERIFWQPDASLPRYDSQGLAGCTADYAWALGRTHHPAVNISYLGETYPTQADDQGHWAFIRSRTGTEPFATPRTVE